MTLIRSWIAASDPFVLAQVASVLTAVLALASAMLLKSARLRAWCVQQISELKSEVIHDSTFDEFCERPERSEIDELRKRVERLESLCEQLAADRDDSEKYQSEEDRLEAPSRAFSTSL